MAILILRRAITPEPEPEEEEEEQQGVRHADSRMISGIEAFHRGTAAMVRADGEASRRVFLDLRGCHIL